jgi:hypothetical protein
MPRYLVERSFAHGLGLPGSADAGPEGAGPLGGVTGGVTAGVISANAQQGVTWMHSYVTPDRQRSYCICDGPSPEAVRSAALSTGLPVDRITEVRVLDPYALA